MSQQILKSLTATLLITALSTTTASYASPAETVKHKPEVELSPSETTAPPIDAPSSYLEAASATSKSETSPSKTSPLQDSQKPEVVKLGEYQSQSSVDPDSTIAKVQPHSISGRRAATLYLRNIPVLTFLGSVPAATGATQTRKLATTTNLLSPSVTISSTQAIRSQDITGDASEQYQSDPVWRATAVASRLNQLNREGVDANSITVSWNAQRERYTIQVQNQTLVEIDPVTFLPDTTRQAEQDALQVANRLRRLLGDAPPLKTIVGKPSSTLNAVLGPVLFSLSGWASWYGPGFHGNPSASGERYNQNAMTAAHRSLPFGTRVKVTNTDNGRSVIVRINDRGPYIHGRIIDLSAAAAQVLGLIQSGVAPVRLEVLGSPTTASLGN